jgi:acetylornithine deacetylase
VVPTEGQNWTRDPFRLTRDGGRRYGRGTTDMKGYLASMLRIADEASRTALTAPLQLVFSYDEEIGCAGIQHMAPALPDLLGRPRLCLVGEPTSMQVAIGHKGKAAIRGIATGQNGHSALAPNFVNALHLASDFTARLSALQNWLSEHGARDPAYGIPFSTVHLGKLTGGTALNIVPDRAEFLCEYRHLSGDDPEMIFARMQEDAAAITARYRPAFAGAALTLELYNSYPGLDEPEDAPEVALARTLAGAETLTKVAFGTEAGVFTRLGLPTVVCGPGDMEDQGHKPDEHLPEDQLLACDRMMDRVLATLSA